MCLWRLCILFCDVWMDGIHIIRGIFGRQGENFIFHYFWSSQPSFVNLQFLLTNSLYKAREKKKNTDPKAK